MARHAEVKEKEIIEAGIAIEKTGKLPNPGAIRAKLGFRGGLLRIRAIWEKYVAEKDNRIGGDKPTELSFTDLPSELAEASNALIDKQKYHLEQTVLHAYQRCQALFEKRLDDQINHHANAISYYAEYEKNADESIQKLEMHNGDLQSENTDLNYEVRNLTVENAKLKGSIAAFERLLHKTQPIHVDQE